MNEFSGLSGATIDRRQFFARGGLALGAMALAQLGERSASGAPAASSTLPRFRPRAKRIIYLFMHGGHGAHAGHEGHAEGKDSPAPGDKS